MTKLLIKLFIKDNQNTKNAAVRVRYGVLAGLSGIATNLILFCLKITVGLMFGSISVTADAVNNLSDSGSSLVTMLGFKIAGKPADAKHPFGHGRAEYISGLAVSFFILFLGFQLIISSVSKIIRPTLPEFSYLTVCVLIVSVFLKLWQCSFYRGISKKIESTALKASSADSRNDVLTTLTVLAGVVITHAAGINLDGYMGAAVALFIIVSGIKLVSDTTSPLLGTAPKKELIDYITKKVMCYDGVIGIHDIAVHNYGPSERYASLHCEVPAEQDVMRSHDIIDNIERDFLENDGIHLVIHLDPVVINDERTNRVREQIAALLADISNEIGMHDFRAVWGITHTNLIFDIVVPFGYFFDETELAELITKRIKALDKSYFPVITVDRGDTSN